MKILLRQLITSALTIAALQVQAVEHPNFIVILGEAQGWASLSVPLDDRNPQGSKSDFIQTPNLDSLANSGVRFSDFYAASPRCTPTRAALFTGRSPAQLHITFVGEGRKDGTVSPGDRVIAPTSVLDLPRSIETLGSMLKKQGYATAHFGKWHVGRISPKEYGFDDNDGPNNNGGPDDVEDPNPKQCHAIARLGIDFITRQTQAGKPFYLQLSEYPGRGPETALPETMEAVKRRLGTRMDYNRIGVAAGNEEIDKTIGLVLAKVKELGITGKTYIIYTADHGAQGRDANGALTNGKGTMWEGGLRVPLLVAGPGIKAGTFAHQRASTVDLFPTIAELSGVAASALPQGLEGGSLTRVLRGGDGTIKRPREEFIVHFPHYDKDEIGPASTITLGQYKMIRVYETGQRMLFDLEKDAAEKHNLGETNVEMVTTLDKRLTEYLTQMNAAIPVPNPNYDPNGERSGDRKGRKGGKGGGKKGKGP